MILFTGDLYLGENEFSISDNALKLINNNEYIISNFENVIDYPNLKKRTDKNSILTFKEEYLDYYLNIITTRPILTLGNNHINDLGQKGIENTKLLLHNKKILNHGAGLYDEVLKPLVIKYKNQKIAIFSVSSTSYDVMSLPAKNNFEGILDINDEKLKKQIREAKGIYDFVIVLPHWGREFTDFPTIENREKAYSWIDSGADLIIGHHPHVIQGKEIYKNKKIYYSLGNYIFPNFYNKDGSKYTWQKKNNHSILLMVEFKDKNIEIQEIGLYFEQKKLLLELNSKSLKYLNKNSEPLVAKNVSMKEYYSIWEKNYIKKRKKYHNKIYQIVNSLLKKHKEYNWFTYLFIRVIKKINFK